MHLRGTKLVPPRKRGPKPKSARTPTQQLMDGIDAETSRARNYISSKARRFIALSAENPVTPPNDLAVRAGFRDPYIGEKLRDRYAHLIAAEYARSRVGSQMELDEALRLTAERARDASLQAKDQLGFLTLILRVHGALSDKPLDGKARRTMAREAAEVVERLQSKLANKPGARARVQAAIGQRGAETTAAVSVEIENEGGDEPSASIAPSSSPSASPASVIELQPQLPSDPPLPDPPNRISSPS